MDVTIVGLGLIGGSIARALKAGGGWTVSGWSRSADTRRAALEAGAIDRAVPLEDAVRDSELIVLAAPPLACLDLLDELGGELRDRLDPAATVTDVASTKARIVERGQALGIPFVGGHPMAGRETVGFGSSSADLFAGRPWVVVRSRTSRDSDMARVAALADACGARTLEMAATTHDLAAAAISHLPLVLSTALVEAVCGRPGEPVPPEWPIAAKLAAGGWRDMTRLARGDAAMGAGIAATNAQPLAAGLRRVRDILDEWIMAVEAASEAADAARLEARFALAAIRLSEASKSAGGQAADASGSAHADPSATGGEPGPRR